MLYTTFIRLCNEAVNHNESDEFIMTLGWQEWMNKASDVDAVTKDLRMIFELANLDFQGLRKRLNLSMAKMAAIYQIPLRSIENWDSGARTPASYIVDFIRFTIYVKEQEGDDGYLGYITEPN